MTDKELQSLKLEIIKIVHNRGISSEDNVKYANVYLNYILENPLPTAPVVQKKQATKKL
jgi:hypothetical protein